jgi:effector-binding domain-containing protein
MKTKMIPIFLFAIKFTIIASNSQAQCEGESFSMTVEYDCSTGTAVISIIPETTFSAPAVWDITPAGYPVENTVSFGFTWTYGVNFPGTYEIEAIEVADPLVYHTFCIELGECLSNSQISTTNSNCSEDIGEFCVIDEDLLPATIYTNTVSYDCATELPPGDYTASIYTEEIDGITNNYHNFPFYIGTNSLNISIEITADSSPCGASIDANVSGGSTNYTFLWTGPEWIEFDDAEVESTTITGGYGTIGLEVLDNITGCNIYSEISFTGTGCAADLNDDGVVGSADLLLFIGQYSLTGGGCYDFNGNGIVGITDMLVMIGGMGNENCP